MWMIARGWLNLEALEVLASYSLCDQWRLGAGLVPGLTIDIYDGVARRASGKVKDTASSTVTS
jgi:hypothetical protein